MQEAASTGEEGATPAAPADVVSAPSVTAGAVTAGGLPFSPPPRGGGETSLAAMPGEVAAETAGAQREAKYREAISELQAEFGQDSVGYSIWGGGAMQLTARVGVSGAGEDRLNGAYRAVFLTPDRVDFEKVGDRSCQICWSEYHGEWRMLIGDFKLGSTLYRHKYRPNLRADSCHGVPEDGWQKWFGREPVPVLRHMAEDEEDEEPTAPETPTEEASIAPASAATTAVNAAAPRAGSQQGKEFIELHSRLEIVAPEVGSSADAVAAGSSAASRPTEVRLRAGGVRVLETSEGLFSEGEVAEESAGGEAAVVESAARVWLEDCGDEPTLPASWQLVQAAKANAQQYFAEGQVAKARRATSAAIAALQQLAAGLGSDGAGDESEEAAEKPSEGEMVKMLGVLHSNRSLLLSQQIINGDPEAVPFGQETAWRLVLADTDAALRADPTSFKASFRRARALFELGELEDALVDANRVVDHYARTSNTPNPEASALRERILAALRRERGKWGEKGPPRWNRGTQEPLISEIGGSSPELAELSAPHRRAALDAPSAKGGDAKAPRLVVAPARPPPAPRTGADVEKALLSSLKGDSARQLSYLREHLTAVSLRRFFRRAPLGPDLLAVLVGLLAEVAEEDTPLAASLLAALADAPSSRTQAAMFSAEEQAALQKLLLRVGGAAAAAWHGEREEQAADGGA